LDSTVIDLVSVLPSKFQAVIGTDTNGKAVMQMYGYDGVPTGKFKVIITRSINDDFVYTKDSDGIKVIANYTRYRTIDTQFSSAETTPF
jgi:hypothetical protein